MGGESVPSPRWLNLRGRVACYVSEATAPMNEFGKSARRHFDFLINEFGFIVTSEDDPVRYDALSLYVEIWSSKGETDVLFGVKADTDILRPYVSHLFILAEVVRYYKKGPFPGFDSYSGAADLTDDQRFLAYLADLMKKYCGEILRGDIKVLEKLSLNRGNKQA